MKALDGHDWSKRCKRYSARYYWDGALWSIDFTAYDMDDAQSRCKQFGIAEFAGETVMAIPCSPTSAPIAGFFARLVCRLGNLLTNKK